MNDSSLPLEIVVISDTHCASIDSIPFSVVEAIKHASLVVHAGDHTSLRLVQELRSTGQYVGVAGNMDEAEIRAELGDFVEIAVGGKRLSIVHGSSSGVGLGDRLLRGLDKPTDVLIYGHSHRVDNRMVNGVLLFNPGSLTRPFPGYPSSYGLLTVSASGSVEGKIVYL